MEEKCSVEKKKKTKLQMLTKIVQILANLVEANPPRVVQMQATHQQKVVQILQNQRIVPTATNFHPKKISQLRDFFITLLLLFWYLDLSQHLF